MMAELFRATGSGIVAPPVCLALTTCAVLDWPWPPVPILTEAEKRNSILAATARLGIVQVAILLLPSMTTPPPVTLGAPTRVNPAGSVSVTTICPVAFGPLLVNVVVKKIVSPTFGVVILANLPSAKSAPTTVIVAEALMAGLGSAWSARTPVTVLTTVLPPAPNFGLTTSSSEAELLTASVPTFQAPVVAL